jgi:hypothetical protein
MLTKKTKQRLTNALTRKTLADEFEAKLTTPGALSSKLKRAIEVAFASKAAALDIIAKLQSGPGALKKDTKARILAEMAEKKAANEVINDLES